MLQSNKSNTLIAVSFFKQDLSLLTYIRFLANYHGFKSKTFSRKMKFNNILGKNKYLFSGPMLLFYSNIESSFDFLKVLTDLKNINVLFFSLSDVILLNNNLSLIKNINFYTTNICSLLSPLFLSSSLNSIKYSIVYLIDAYSKSVIKKS